MCPGGIRSDPCSGSGSGGSGAVCSAVLQLCSDWLLITRRIFFFFSLPPHFFFFLSFFFFFFSFYPEGGLRPGVAELWSRSTPTGMRIVSDLRAAPLASSLPFKAANCRGHKARATADCLLRAEERHFTLQTSCKLNQVLLQHSMNDSRRKRR